MNEIDSKFIISENYNNLLLTEKESGKYYFFAQKMEDIFLETLPKELHDEFDMVIDSYFDFWAKKSEEFETFTYKFLRKIFYL